MSQQPKAELNLGGHGHGNGHGDGRSAAYWTGAALGALAAPRYYSAPPYGYGYGYRRKCGFWPHPPCRRRRHYYSYGGAEFPIEAQNISQSQSLPKPRSGGRSKKNK